MINNNNVTNTAGTNLPIIRPAMSLLQAFNINGGLTPIGCVFKIANQLIALGYQLVTPLKPTPVSKGLCQIHESTTEVTRPIRTFVAFVNQSVIAELFPVLRLSIYNIFNIQFEAR
jgi:hypothetical protein